MVCHYFSTPCHRVATVPLVFVCFARPLLWHTRETKVPFFLIRVKKLPFFASSVPFFKQNQKSAYLTHTNTHTQGKCTKYTSLWENPKNDYQEHKTKEDLVLLISHDTVIVSWFSYPITHLLSLTMAKSDIRRDPDFVVIAISLCTKTIF